MKILSSVFVLAIFISAVGTFAVTNSTKVEKKDLVSPKIEKFLSSANLDHDTESVKMFSNFLVNEDGDLYTVDFIVTEKGEIVVLSKDIEEEYYRFDSYSTMNMEQYSFPVASVTPFILKA